MLIAADSGAIVVSLLAAGTSLLVEADGSADAFSASVPGVEVSVVAVLLWGTARLGLRKRVPNFDDFLPSPSVPSVSELASGFRSFFVPRVLKNDVRRAGLLSGTAVVAFASVAAAEGSVDVGAGAIAVSTPEALAGSSICGAFEEVSGVSESLAGTAGAVSVAGLAGPVVSLLLKKLPKIEFLFVDFGAVSRAVVPVTGSVGDAIAGSVMVVAASVGAPSPFVVIGVDVVIGSEPLTGSTGDPMTRAAKFSKH